MKRVSLIRLFCRMFIAGALLVAALSVAYWAYYSDVFKVEQLWVSSGAEYDNSESLAVCRLEDGELLVYVTDKGSHHIDAYDAETGKLFRRYGCEGNGAGQFKRPNGIIALDMPAKDRDGNTTGHASAVLVIERDNKRIQAFWADGFRPAGMFGMGELVNPYGCAVSYHRGKVYLYVTDNTREAGDERVKVYCLTCNQGRIDGRLDRTFGDCSGKGLVRVAESIVVDDRFDRVLLCDEARVSQNVKVYTRNGHFTGKTFADGLFWNDPEGIALVDGPGCGFVIVTDQQRHRTIWHLFDRENYEHLGAFTGRRRIGKTDGICVYQHPVEAQKDGLFFAVHRDSEIHAFALHDIISIVHQHHGYKIHGQEQQPLAERSERESHKEVMKGKVF